jgi:hypothetical protein
MGPHWRIRLMPRSPLVHDAPSASRIVYESCLTLSLQFPIGAVGVITVTL